MTETNSKIFLVDDDLSVRSSLSMLLNSAGYKVICFKSAEDFLEFGVEKAKIGCLILDIKMPGLSGLDLQKELASMDRKIPIIFITGHGDIPASVRAMREGAVHFLTKPFDDHELLDAVHEAILIGINSQKEQSEQIEIKKKIDALSPREYEVLRYLITGMLNKQVAYKMDISERTVKAHRKQIMDKMGILSMAELVRLTEKVGITPKE